MSNIFVNLFVQVHRSNAIDNMMGNRTQEVDMEVDKTNIQSESQQEKGGKLYSL